MTSKEIITIQTDKEKTSSLGDGEVYMAFSYRVSQDGQWVDNQAEHAEAMPLKLDTLSGRNS